MGGDIRTRGPGKGSSPPAGPTGALASGVIQLSNFALYNHTAGTGHGTILVNGTNVTVTAYSFTARANIDLGPTNSDTGVLTGTSINHGQLCLDGNGNVFCTTDPRVDANDVYGVFSSLTPSPNDPAGPAFSYGDQQCAGGVFSSIPTVANPMGMQSGAATQTHAPGVNSSGDSTAYDTLTCSFVLVNETGGVIDIAFNAADYCEGWASGDTSLLAHIGCEIKLHDDTSNTVVFDWLPDGTTGALSPGGTSVVCPFSLNDTITYNSPAAGTTFLGASLGNKNASAAFKGETPILTTGHTFTLTVNITVLNQVPPPN